MGWVNNEIGWLKNTVDSLENMADYPSSYSVGDLKLALRDAKVYYDNKLITYSKYEYLCRRIKEAIKGKER